MESNISKKSNLLLVSGGSLVGQNVMQALASRRQGLTIFATNSEPNEPSLKDFNQVFITPPTKGYEIELIDLILRIIKEKDIGLIIPCRDEDVLLLSKLRSQYPEYADRILAGSESIARIFLDKMESWSFSQKQKLPFGPSCALTDEKKLRSFAENIGFPLILKPREGFASKGVKLLTNFKQLEQYIGDSKLMVQQYLGTTSYPNKFLSDAKKNGLPLFFTFEEDKHSIQSIIGKNGQVVSTYASIHRMRNGISSEVYKSSDSNLLTLGKKWAEAFAAAGWVGPLNIQCQKTDDANYKIYEYNGRFTGATAARYLLGFDEMGIIGNLFLDWPEAPYADTEYKKVEKKLISFGL